ncbi:hypothetical protein LDENG_00149040 [Lucifuga dentata]|nr:hypothetical protein LDENG_00149040 [Lucifuga dentata]
MNNEHQSTNPGHDGTIVPISQIPGLSPAVSGELPEEKARRRRFGVLESDSDYVKLAKQGGHKGLLWHEGTVTSTPNSYKPPGWFSAASEDNSKLSEEKKSPGAFHQLKPPFGNDSMSAWERTDSSKGSKKQTHACISQMENSLLSNQYHQTSKFRRIMFDKRPAPVNMSKLLSFGYVEDEKPTASTDVSN